MVKYLQPCCQYFTVKYFFCCDSFITVSEEGTVDILSIILRLNFLQHTFLNRYVCMCQRFV